MSQMLTVVKVLLTSNLFSSMITFALIHLIHLNMWVVLLIHPNIMNLTHSGNASDSIMDRCPVLKKI
jgi:hypothetical protein